MKNEQATTGNETIVIEICTDPEYYDAEELVFPTSLTAAGLMEIFAKAVADSLKASGVFDGAEIKIIPPTEMRWNKWDKQKWSYHNIIATRQKVSKAQERAIDNASGAGNGAMMKACDNAMLPDWENKVMARDTGTPYPSDNYN